MSTESRERIETNRREIPIEDRNGDKGREERIEYSDGSWVGRGEIIEGPSRGQKWIKGEGGTAQGELTELTALGIGRANVEQFTAGRWGAIIAQGENSQKPERGSNWLWAQATVSEHPARIHGDELLVDRGIQSEADERGRETYKLVRNPNGEVIVMVTSYDDASGMKVLTGKHLAGPKAGHAWEERTALTPAAEQGTDISLATAEGSIDRLRVRGFSRDLVDDPEKQKSLPLHLKLAGEWKPVEYPEAPNA